MRNVNRFSIIFIFVFITGIGNVFAEEPVIFIDKNLEKTIRDEIGKYSGPILQDDLLKITELYISQKNIRNLSGIEYLGNLTLLSISENSIPLSKYFISEIMVSLYEYLLVVYFCYGIIVTFSVFILVLKL